MPISERPITQFARRACLLALAPATCLLFATPLSAQSSSSLAEAEMQRRVHRAEEARELLTKGDESYRAGKWSEAVAAFGGAHELLPQAPATAELRNAAAERLAQASVERARQQIRQGDVKGAGETLDKVLLQGVAPDHAGALELRAQIDDPIRTNPAATLEHTQEVEEVRMLLYKAEGAYNIGDFDRAGMIYTEILRVDRYNRSARRGLEQVAQAKADYFRSAGDQTRAEMLSALDGAWELPVTPAPASIADINGGGAENDRILLSHKLEQIVMPTVDFEDVSIFEAYDFLRARSVELDTVEPDPAARGVNFVLELGDDEVSRAIRNRRIDLQLRNIPLSEVVKHIGNITRTMSVTHDFAVAIRPLGAVSEDLIFRTYRVPSDFLASLGAIAGTSQASSDAFGSGGSSEGVLARRMSAQEVLAEKGVVFSEGASANFSQGVLTVRNTASNHALVENLVEAVAAEEPVNVVVEVRMVKVQHRALKELGFDWLLGEFSLGGTGLTPGTQALTLSGGGNNPDNFLDIPVLPGVYDRKSITSGNRSGDEAIVGSGLDGLLERQLGVVRGNSRAPGILGLNGIVNNTEISMLMRGFDQKKNIDLVVAPSVTTRNGHQATVQVIREFIYPTEYEPPELPNTVGTGGTLLDLDTGEVTGETLPAIPVTPATPTNFTTENIGVILDVLPTVSADRQYVDVVLKPRVTDFDGFVNFGSPILSPSVDLLGNPSSVVLTPNQILQPVFSRMATDTRVSVADGATMVIGGLLKESIQKVEDKTPILGNIPLVGSLFRSQATEPVRTAVVFFVTVKVIDASGQSFSSR